MRKSTASKIIAFTGKDMAKPDDLHATSSFIRNMLHYPDSKEAGQIIAEQAELEFDQAQGAEAEKLKYLQNDLDARFKISKATLETLEDKLKNTKQYVKSGFVRSGGDHD